MKLLAAIETIKAANEKNFKAGVARFGLKDSGVDFAIDQNNEIFFDQESDAYLLIAYGATRRVETENFTASPNKKNRYANSI